MGKNRIALAVDSCRKLTVACRGKGRGNIKTTVKTCLSFLGNGKVKMSIIVLWSFSVEMIPVLILDLFQAVIKMITR